MLIVAKKDCLNIFIIPNVKKEKKRYLALLIPIKKNKKKLKKKKKKVLKKNKPTRKIKIKGSKKK